MFFKTTKTLLLQGFLRAWRNDGKMLHICNMFFANKVFVGKSLSLQGVRGFLFAEGFEFSDVLLFAFDFVLPDLAVESVLDGEGVFAGLAFRTRNESACRDERQNTAVSRKVAFGRIYGNRDVVGGDDVVIGGVDTVYGDEGRLAGGAYADVVDGRRVVVFCGQRGRGSGAVQLKADFVVAEAGLFDLNFFVGVQNDFVAGAGIFDLDRV